MFRATALARVSARAFHTSPVSAKTVTEKVTETAHDVNIKVGRTLAAGIEKGQKATKATKETLGIEADEAKKKAEETAATAGQKANQAAAGARVAKEDFKNEVRK